MKMRKKKRRKRKGQKDSGDIYMVLLVHLKEEQEWQLVTAA
jgi:hypothetical protein